MKDIKQEADLLIEKFSRIQPVIKSLPIIHAITSVENTIKVLEEIKNSISDDWYKVNVTVSINEKTDLLNELKSRL